MEAGRWAPTAHNTQDFEPLIIDDRGVLEKLWDIRSPVSETFLWENYEQPSFSEEELRRKKVGILGTAFPPAWTDPSMFSEVAGKDLAIPFKPTLASSPVVLIVISDPGRRAPDSGGTYWA